MKKKNIITLFKKIKRVDQKLNILFVDDNSTDGTRDEILNLKKNNKSVYHIF